MNVNATSTASAKSIDNLHQYQTVVEGCHFDGRTPCHTDFSEDDTIDLTQDGPQPVQQIKGNNSTPAREWISLLEVQSQETEETEDYRGGQQGKKEGVTLLDEDTLVCETEDEASGVRRAIYQEYEPKAYHEVSEIDCSGHETTAPRHDSILVEDDCAGSDREVHEEEGENTPVDYGRVQMPQVIKYISKDHDPADDVVEGDEGDHGYGMAVAATVFDDEYLDLLFSRIARLYEQLPTRVAQDMLPYMFTSSTPISSASSSSNFETINNGDPNTTASSATTQAVTTFSQPSKTNWKEKTLVTKKQKEVFEVEKRVVRSVLEKVRDSESADEMLMQGRGNVGGGNGRRRRGSGTNAGVDGGASLRERVESAKEAVEADVVREGGIRRYHDDLGLADGIAWKFERCPQIYTKHKV
ncbi:hypothetical protein KI688_012550 [Linnemannia hyalina]|uniref:Uncharacterized protein n=1 Tax=Linnemannia hyalina TaxID=64524 RepID=A0A9P8BV65_9FUNG|nr:hypothetical protein KI688_012550 [Linnemannia hyalina]